MAGLRFLERLRKMQKDPNLHVAPTLDEVLASVTDYVSKILNTRKGSTVLDKNFGIPDFTSIGLSFSEGDMPVFEKEIASFVERCEPRLSNVSVRFLPEEGALFMIVFSLNAQLRFHQDELFPVHFVTRVDPLGKVTVSI